jgi:hypothetical protein
MDTLRYAKRLEEAGVDEPQAEAQAEALYEALRESTPTREDYVRLEGRVNLLQWMVGVVLALQATTLVKLFV